MALLRPTPTPYDPLEWVARPFESRARAVCEAWALDGYGTPGAVYGVYLLKVAFYVGGWAFFVNLSPAAWLSPVAFQKAILWSLLFEGLGLGCGSGPLTGRYLPPVGGFLYWLRPGTTKLSLFGGWRRTWLDIVLYAALLVLLVRALIAPAPANTHLIPIAIGVPLLGIRDRTLFL